MNISRRGFLARTAAGLFVPSLIVPKPKVFDLGRHLPADDQPMWFQMVIGTPERPDFAVVAMSRLEPLPPLIAFSSVATVRTVRATGTYRQHLEHLFWQPSCYKKFVGPGVAGICYPGYLT